MGPYMLHELTAGERRMAIVLFRYSHEYEPSTLLSDNYSAKVFQDFAGSYMLCQCCCQAEDQPHAP